ncbi:hypothetical protein B0G76_1308 [Paraburkholderia sp. BL23I1N1]|uniref:hypothetical protein n=1 Tax=Paraburkholderia sp. BL23I1N1 TaxID=1938802 RepID=UPI000E771531|nr:hypothetical protein [Paraburkholderia sp. BL23I1N1]RKE35247.1 hypothetical protein B0G76_1308 [Paraburkholderia sp. BL23I1N1]
MRYYHGGAGHLQKDQILLQPAITTDAHAAFVDAALVRSDSGAVYEVIPTRGSARIVRIVQVLTKQERDAATRQLPNAPAS